MIVSSARIAAEVRRLAANASRLSKPREGTVQLNPLDAFMVFTRKPGAGFAGGWGTTGSAVRPGRMLEPARIGLYPPRIIEELRARYCA